MSPGQTSWHAARNRLASLWAGFFVLLVGFLAVVSLTAEGGIEAHWKWLLPTLMPTASLIVGAYAADATQQSRGPAQVVSTASYRLAFGVSLFYLVLVTLVYFGGAAVAESRIEAMEDSNLYLGPLQGLVALSLGVFFLKRDAEAGEAE